MPASPQQRQRPGLIAGLGRGLADRANAHGFTVSHTRQCIASDVQQYDQVLS